MHTIKKPKKISDDRVDLSFNEDLPTPKWNNR